MKNTLLKTVEKTAPPFIQTTAAGLGGWLGGWLGGRVASWLGGWLAPGWLAGAWGQAGWVARSFFQFLNLIFKNE